MTFNAVGWDKVRSEDVRLGYINNAIANAATALNPARGGSNVIEYKFDYIAIKPYHRTHYVVIMLSENARYTSHVLRSISHGPRVEEIASIKSVSVHPRMSLAELEGAQAQFTSPPDFLPALIIEVWSSESMQLRDMVHSDSGSFHETPETFVGHDKGSAFISGSVMDPEGISNMPPMRVRLLETVEDRPAIRIPTQNHLRAHEKTIVESMHRAMDRIHTPSRDYPRERRTAVTRDEFFTHYTLSATNYSMPFVLEDFMSLYMFNMTQIKEIYYDCTIVSSSGERPIARGALVVKLMSNINDITVPSFGDASERQHQYHRSQPRLVFTLPAKPAIIPMVLDAARMPPPRSKRRVPDISTRGVMAASETAATVTTEEAEEDAERNKRTRVEKKPSELPTLVAPQAGAAPLRRTRSIRNLFGLLSSPTVPKAPVQ